jgi:hypothetical protein
MSQARMLAAYFKRGGLLESLRSSVKARLPKKRILIQEID